MTRVIHPMHCENNKVAGANASHRAGRASHRATLRCLDHSATIAFADGPAVEWVADRCDLARQLNEESTRDGSAANNRLPTDHGD